MHPPKVQAPTPPLTPCLLLPCWMGVHQQSTPQLHIHPMFSPLSVYLVVVLVQRVLTPHRHYLAQPYQQATLHLNGCMVDLEILAHALLGWIIVIQGVLRGPTQKDFVQGPASEAWSLETTPENQSLINPNPNPSSEMCGTEAWSLETVPENQPLEPNLESPSNPITSNGSPDVDMVNTTDFQPSSSLAITGSAGLCHSPVTHFSTTLVLSLVPFLGASGTCHIDSGESEADDDDTPLKCRKKPGKWGQKLLACKVINHHSAALLIICLSQDAFHKYLEEKGVKKHRGDSMLPKSAPPDSVRKFNATNNHLPTLSDLMINWSSSLIAPGRNTEVIQLLTIDFQQKLKNGTYPLVMFNEGKMNLLMPHKLCIEKLCWTCREKQNRVKLATTDIAAWKERRHKLNRMTTCKHGTLV
ncbi:hypothetical protein BS17DRAFT_768135 [Gyrodon lividus]|nr:hypothetical protein BS17DRAFT_768135 [Gyrodon lividus]